MALELVGGAFVSSFLSVLFDRMASGHVVDSISGQKTTTGLLKKMKLKLLSINVVLKYAEEKQIRDPTVKEWLEELKDDLYAAVDLLDEIKPEALRRKLDDESGSSSTSQVQNLENISFDEFEKTLQPKIMKIVERLELIVNEKDVLGLRGGVKDRPQGRRLESTLVDDSKEAIVKLLLWDDETDDEIIVIPIVGMGGIGKSTVVQLINNVCRVKSILTFEHGFVFWNSLMLLE